MRLPRASHILTRPLFLFCSVALLVIPFLPRSESGVTLCGFYTVTGLPCWGCGMTRALGNIAHGDFQLASAYHPFAFLLFPFLIFFGIIGLRKGWSQRFQAFLMRHDKASTHMFWALFALFFVFGLWRMAFCDTWLGHQLHYRLFS